MFPTVFTTYRTLKRSSQNTYLERNRARNFKYTLRCALVGHRPLWKLLVHFFYSLYYTPLSPIIITNCKN